MALNFPRVAEIRLARPPLAEVICQVRFPPDLRILTEAPSQFQERVRRRFPELALEQGMIVRMPGSGGSEPPTADFLPKIYRFRTADGLTSISLSTDFCALSTQDYSHWRLFADDLDMMSQALNDIYEPGYATRIGLRYVNRLTSQNTGVAETTALIDLVRPELTTTLRSDAWTEPASMLCQLVLMDGEAKLAIRTAYGREEDVPFLLLDFDYFEEGQLPLSNLSARCERYHLAIYDAFRWSLRDSALELFGPVAEERAP